MREDVGLMLIECVALFRRTRPVPGRESLW